MDRELGSDAKVTIHGGAHDGVTGSVLRVFERGDGVIRVVQLPDGSTVEIAYTDREANPFPRETGI